MPVGESEEVPGKEWDGCQTSGKAYRQKPETEKEEVLGESLSDSSAV